MAPCCSCNGKNAVCKRCACVRAGRPCNSCLLLKFHRCSNILASRAGSAADSGVVSVNRSSVTGGTHVTDVLSVSSASVCALDSSSQLVSQQQGDSMGYDSCVNNVNVPSYINDLII